LSEKIISLVGRGKGDIIIPVGDGVEGGGVSVRENKT